MPRPTDEVWRTPWADFEEREQAYRQAQLTQQAKTKGKGKGKDLQQQQNTPVALTLKEYLPRQQFQGLWAQEEQESEHGLSQDELNHRDYFAWEDEQMNQQAFSTNAGPTRTDEKQQTIESSEDAVAAAYMARQQNEEPTPAEPQQG